MISNLNILRAERVINLYQLQKLDAEKQQLLTATMQHKITACASILL